MKSQDIRLSARLKKYLLWPWASQFLLLVFTWITYLLNKEIGLAFLVLSLVHGAVFTYAILKAKKTLQQEILRLSLSASELQKEHLYYFDIPHAVLDANGVIEWYDEKFGELIPDQNYEIGRASCRERV